MKKLSFLFILLGVVVATSCNAQSDSKNQTKYTAEGKVEVYYFHFTGRCVTCKTVEAEAKTNVETIYAEQFKSGKISFPWILRHITPLESDAITVPLSSVPKESFKNNPPVTG